MSDEFDGLDATEKAGIEGALIGVAPSRPKLRADSVTRGPSTSLTSCRWQTFTRSVENAPTPVVTGSQVQH
jgi:hypothetical protein